MAKTITLSLAISLAGDGVSLNGSSSFAATQAGTGGIGNTQNVGTTQEALSFIDTVVAGGYLAIFNLDSTNYCEVDSANTFDKFPQKITPGKFILLMPQTSTIYGKANTAATNLWIVGVTL